MPHLAGPMGKKNDKGFQRAYWKAFEEFFGANAATIKAMLLAKHAKGDTGGAEIDRVCYGLRESMGWLAEAIEKRALSQAGHAGRGPEREPEGDEEGDNQPPISAKTGPRPGRPSSRR